MVEGRFAGVDRASEEHAVRAVDETGRIVEGRRFRHDENGLRALCARLGVRLEVKLVAIERPDGRVFEPAAGCRAGGDGLASQTGAGSTSAVHGGGWQARGLGSR